MPTITYHARWIAPVTSEPIENGHLVVQDGRIADVHRAKSRDSAAMDLGDVIVVPGFVNAHTHLELGFCHNRVPCKDSFVRWIQDLTLLLVVEGGADKTVLSQSLRAGIQQSLAAGVTAVADVGHDGHPITPWHEAPIHTIGFLEVLGIGSRRSADHKRSLGRVIARCDAETLADHAAEPNKNVPLLKRLGLSPHAPYSTDTAVYREAITYTRQTNRPISTHLAETREECRFLADGTGPFRELLEMWHLWDGSFTPPACSPVAYADRIGLLDCDPILAHVNYADDHDLQRLAKSSAGVAYCPRAHAFFGHEAHRYAEMVAAGINVCIGTDSLAGNDTLSVLDELRFLWAQRPSTKPEPLLVMGTIAGARALKLHGQIGSLDRDKRADFVVIPLATPRTDSPLEDLLSSTLQPLAVYVGGQNLV